MLNLAPEVPPISNLSTPASSYLMNASNLQNGMVLVFNGVTNKFDATLELTPGAAQNLDINGGNF